MPLNTLRFPEYTARMLQASHEGSNLKQKFVLVQTTAQRLQTP